MKALKYIVLILIGLFFHYLFGFDKLSSYEQSMVFLIILTLFCLNSIKKRLDTIQQTISSIEYNEYIKHEKGE